MTARHVVRKAGDARFPTPAKFVGHSNGFGRWDIVGESDAVHTGFGVCQLTGEGDVEWHVHSYEVSWYVIEGEVVLETDDGTFLLRPGDYGVLTVGAPHSAFLDVDVRPEIPRTANIVIQPNARNSRPELFGAC